MASAKRTDWQTIAHESAVPIEEGGLSEEDGAALEGRIVADENDVDARVRLVGFYFLRFSPDNHQRRAEHLAWLAEHRPDIGLGGFGYIEEKQAPEGHEATRRAWVAVSAQPDADVRILENAADFLGFNRPEEAEPLFRRAAAMEPENGEWRTRIAWTLAKRAEWADDPEERRRYARAAVEELETALTLAHADWIALGNCIDLTKAAVLAEDWERVRETAERVLVDNETCTRTFQYGNAIHWANIALGWAALAHDQLTAASEYLVRAGKTPAPPNWIALAPTATWRARCSSAGSAQLSSRTSQTARDSGRETKLFSKDGAPRSSAVSRPCSNGPTTPTTLELWVQHQRAALSRSGHSEAWKCSAPRRGTNRRLTPRQGNRAAHRVARVAPVTSRYVGPAFDGELEETSHDDDGDLYSPALSTYRHQAIVTG